MVENPVETCEMEPIHTCKHVTKLVPKLVPVEKCADVPKEICARSKTNPRKIKKPLIKKWCYVPSKESGLLTTTPSTNIDTVTVTSKGNASSTTTTSSTTTGEFS